MIFMLLYKNNVPTVLLIFSWLQGCATAPPPALSSETIAEPIALPLSTEIAETSGLACLPQQQFLTINDSGNPSIVYQLDKKGHIVTRFEVSENNQDWEAITLHQGQLWIADIGNNSGQRQHLQLYKSELPNYNTRQLNTEKFQLHYAEIPKHVPTSYEHNLDAEALVSTGEQLLMFSKNWAGNQSTVYEVDTNVPASKLKPIGQTSHLPGLITDVAFSTQHNLFVVAGYQNFRQNPFSLMLTGNFEPFLAVLDRQFQLQAIVPVATGGQLEAVCVDENQQVWLSQEKSRQQPALFWRWGTLEQLIGQIK